MTVPVWHEEAITKRHDRKAFDCGDPDLNLFLQCYARQSHEQGGAKTFLAIDDGDGQTIHGYCSLAPAALTYRKTPESIRRGLAQHDVPGFCLARLATDLRQQGRRLGGQLLAAAALRCIRAARAVGGVILIIDAKKRPGRRVVRVLRGSAIDGCTAHPGDVARELRKRTQGPRAL